MSEQKRRYFARKKEREVRDISRMKYNMYRGKGCSISTPFSGKKMSNKICQNRKGNIWAKNKDFFVQEEVGCIWQRVDIPRMTKGHQAGE